jgi:hypothetical protein
MVPLLFWGVLEVHLVCLYYALKAKESTNVFTPGRIYLVLRNT